MKILGVILSVYILALSPVYAEDIDLFSDNPDLNSATEETQNNEAQNEDAEEEEDSGSFLSSIIDPIVKIFKSDEKVTEIAEGEKESPLDRSIRLANEGSVEDQVNLGYIYYVGANGVEPDFEKAFKYYEMAAKQDDPVAVTNLGSFYFSGIGVKKNYNMAISLYTKAADLGNDNAALNLAFILLTGGAKNSQRNQEAFELLKKAHKSGNKIAEFMLGYAYYKGFATEQNFPEAYKLIKDAANGKAQIDEAQLVLADMYVEGIGTVQNYQAAIKSYNAAVSQGNMEAILALAEVYSEGKITPQNKVLAHALYNIAAANGVPGAAEKRDELSEEMQMEALTNAQTSAQNYKSSPSELTNYIRQTFGYNIRSYIDKNISAGNKKQEK